MKEIAGNILDVTRGIIVHGCNCQGVMGAGVAKAIKEKWPRVDANYRMQYNDGAVFLGDIQVCTKKPDLRLFDKYNSWTTPDLPDEVIVINAFTQFSYGTEKRQVDYDAVSACFAKVRMIARDTGLPVFFPKIGAGLGGGDWAEIAPRIEAALGSEIEATLVNFS